MLKVAHWSSSAHRDADGPAKQLNSHIVSCRFFQDSAATGRVTTLMTQDDWILFDTTVSWLNQEGDRFKKY